MFAATMPIRSIVTLVTFLVQWDDGVRLRDRECEVTKNRLPEAIHPPLRQPSKELFDFKTSDKPFISSYMV